MRDQGERPSGPLFPLSGFAAAALFGFLMLPLMARGDWSRLLGSAEYRTWQILVVVQAALWILAASYTRGIWHRVAAAPLPRSARLAIFMFWFLAVVPFVLFETTFPVSESNAVPIVPLPVIFGSVASAIVAAGIFRLHVLANDWLLGRFSPEDPTGAYQELSGLLDRHLLLLGAILAGSVIGAAASREAFFAIDGKYLFPAEQAWQLAVYWSALLAVIYSGSRNALRRIAYRLRDKLLADSSSDPGDKKRLERERAIDKVLCLDRTYLEELQSAFSVVTPIAGAIASQLMQLI